VRDAPTVFGSLFGYTLAHDAMARTVRIAMHQPAPAHVRYLYPCQFGNVVSAEADGCRLAVVDNHMLIPAQSRNVVVRY
jgi:hypothetical protein